MGMSSRDGGGGVMPILRAASSRSLTSSSSDSSIAAGELSPPSVPSNSGTGVLDGCPKGASSVVGLLAFDDRRKSFSLLRAKSEDERSREGPVVGGFE